LRKQRILWRASAPNADKRRSLRTLVCAADNGWIASFGAPLPSLFFARAVEFLAWRGGRKARTRSRRENGFARHCEGVLHFVIAGLDPAIHAAFWLAESHRTICFRCTSAWTTGSSPVVTIEKWRALKGDNMAENLTPEDFQKRFDTAAQAAQREYCDIFEFWRACRLKSCRRSKACGGDPQLCLKRGYAQVPDELSGRALARVIAATADDADRPTKLARQMSPQSFYLWPLKDEPTAGAVL
jgi:hypothetical protein